MVMGMTFSLKKRSSRNLPLMMRSLRLRVEAAMIRVSKAAGSLEPRGSKTCSIRL